MTDLIRTMKSDYMDFAKFGNQAKFSLASSGVLDCSLADLELTLADLALHGPNAGGFAPLVERIAGRFSVPPSCVIAPGGGCSFANHLAMAALVTPGSQVVVEDPTYELLLSTLGYFQAEVRPFARSSQDRWRLDPERVTAAITPKTRLVVLTNLHNPSSALAEDEAILAVAAAAEKVGAMVIVDEVYRELTFRDGRASTVFRPDGNIVVTSSLTKAYGLSALRCGWILAPATVTERLHRLNDLFGVHPPHVAERMAVLAFDQLERFRSRANGMIDQNRTVYRELLGGHPALDQSLFDQGTTVFPRLRSGDGDQLFARLMTDFETSLVPGRFFGMADYVRIGLGGEPKATQTALERLAAALA